MSNGLVDGILHDVPGKKTKDRAILGIKYDQTVTHEILSQFLSTSGNSKDLKCVVRRRRPSSSSVVVVVCVN